MATSRQSTQKFSFHGLGTAVYLCFDHENLLNSKKFADLRTLRPSKDLLPDQEEYSNIETECYLNISKIIPCVTCLYNCIKI